MNKTLSHAEILVRKLSGNLTILIIDHLTFTFEILVTRTEVKGYQ